MKKIVLAMLSGLAVTASAVDAMPFKGMYLGAGVGAGHATGKSSHYQGAQLQSINKLGDASAVGGIHLGYGILSKNSYLGLELHGAFSNYSLDSHTVPAARTSYKSKYAWGITLRPGMLISPSTLAYVTLGGAQSKIHYRNPSLFYKTSYNRWSPVVGFGLETAVKPCVKVGVDLTSSLGRKISFVSTSAERDNFKLRFGSSAVTARVSYVL
jgi:opacity protein-like surface antigen